MATCLRCGAGIGPEEPVCPECGRARPVALDAGAASETWQPPADDTDGGSRTDPAERQDASGHGPFVDTPAQGDPSGPGGRPDPLRPDRETEYIEPESRFLGRFFAGISVVTAFVAVFFLPPVFGAISVYTGYRVRREYETSLGTVLVAVGVGATLVGMAIGLILLAG